MAGNNLMIRFMFMWNGSAGGGGVVEGMEYM